MKFAEEIKSFLDARLAIIASTTSVVGLGAAHWNGLRAAGESSYGGAFAAAHYEIAFGYVTWTVMVVLIAAAGIVGLATGGKSRESRRFVVQLFMTLAIFGALNLILLQFRLSSL